VAKYAGGGCVGVEGFLSLACSERNMMVVLLCCCRGC
jgi:hypothetical protein